MNSNKISQNNLKILKKYFVNHFFKNGKKIKSKKLIKNSYLKYVLKYKNINDLNKTFIFSYELLSPNINIKAWRRGRKNIIKPTFLKDTKSMFYYYNFLQKNTTLKKNNDFYYNVIQNVNNSISDLSKIINTKKVLYNTAFDNLYRLKKRKRFKRRKKSII